MNIVTLSVPAKSEWTLVLRMTVSGIGAVLDMPIDVIDDLKTALDESADLLMHQSFCVETFDLQADLDKDGLHVRLSAKRCDTRTNENPIDPTIAGLIIGTLVREVQLDSDSDGISSVNMLLPVK